MAENQTLEELQLEVAAQTEKIGQLETDSLNKDLTIESLEKDLNSSMEVISDLKAQLKNSAKKVGKNPSIKIEGKTYEVVSGASHKQIEGSFTKEEISKNPELAKKILEITGQSVLIAI